MTEQFVENSDLKDFARRVTREVCVRAAGHRPQGVDEVRQAREGPCQPMQLDAVRRVLGFSI